MTSGSETGQVTGTKDKDYNIIWFTEACLSNALRLETYIQDAEREGDSELAEFAVGKLRSRSVPAGCHPRRHSTAEWGTASAGVLRLGQLRS